MEREEQYLLQHFGKQRPFRVPDDYFEQFASRLAERLPEQPQPEIVREKPVTVIRRPWRVAIAVAACLCLLFLGASLYLRDAGPAATVQPSPTAQNHTVEEESNLDAMADYAMIDNDDIYAFVSNN